MQKTDLQNLMQIKLDFLAGDIIWNTTPHCIPGHIHESVRASHIKNQSRIHFLHCHYVL